MIFLERFIEIELCSWQLQSAVTPRSYVDERFQLCRALRALIRSSGFHACFGPRRARRALIRGKLQVFGFNGCFGLRACFGLRHALRSFDARFGLPCTLRRAAGAISIGCWGRRKHRGRRHWPQGGTWTGAHRRLPAAALPGLQWILL